MDEESQSCGRSWWSSPSPLDFMYGFATGVLDRDFDSDRFLDDAHMQWYQETSIEPYLACDTCGLLLIIQAARAARTVLLKSGPSQQFVDGREAACNATPLACLFVSVID